MVSQNCVLYINEKRNLKKINFSIEENKELFGFSFFIPEKHLICGIVLGGVPIKGEKLKYLNIDPLEKFMFEISNLHFFINESDFKQENLGYSFEKLIKYVYFPFLKGKIAKIDSIEKMDASSPLFLNYTLSADLNDRDSESPYIIDDIYLSYKRQEDIEYSKVKVNFGLNSSQLNVDSLFSENYFPPVSFGTEFFFSDGRGEFAPSNKVVSLY